MEEKHESKDLKTASCLSTAKKGELRRVEGLGEDNRGLAGFPWFEETFSGKETASRMSTECFLMLLLFCFATYSVRNCSVSLSFTMKSGSPGSVHFLLGSASLRNFHTIPSLISPTFSEPQVGIRYMDGPRGILCLAEATVN